MMMNENIPADKFIMHDYIMQLITCKCSVQRKCLNETTNTKYNETNQECQI